MFPASVVFPFSVYVDQRGVVAVTAPAGIRIAGQTGDPSVVLSAASGPAVLASAGGRTVALGDFAGPITVDGRPGLDLSFALPDGRVITVAGGLVVGVS